MGAFASKRDKTDSHKKPRNSTTSSSNPTTSSTGVNNTSSSSSSSSSSGPVAKNSLSVLLLGTGETGKSTLFKQLELINGVGIIKENERSMWAALIHGNVISDMKTLIGIVEETDNQEVSDEMHELIQEILELPDQSVMINAELCEKLKKLWNYEVIKHAYDNRDQALDSAEYLYNNIDRIAQPDYSPTVDDVLHCRVKTLGVHHVELIMDGNFKFKLIDVGGQRSERRKWLELMSEVDAVIFMTSLAEFDQECYEEKGFKRIVESLETFEKVINNKLFQKVPFILMLNKRDLFERKIDKKSFKKYFPNYAGDEKNAQQCIDFISKMFLEKCKERSTDTILVQPHCAINKEETEQMLQHAKSFVISQYSKKK